MNLISRVDARVEARLDIMDGWTNSIKLNIYIQHV